MLEAIRNRSNGPIAKFIIGLIIVPFAFAGVYSYFNTNGSGSVATVNGDDISLVAFNRAYQSSQSRWGDNFDAYFNTDERLQQFRLTVLQQLINQRLSSQAIDEMGLRISDVSLRKLIKSNAQFYDENGVFNQNNYNLSLRSRGYSPQQYQAIMKNDLASEQFIKTLQDSNFVLDNELELNVSLQNQTRNLDYLIIPSDFYSSQIDLTDEQGDSEIKSYYELNANRFSIAEKVSIEYVYMTRKDPSNIIISDGQIADFYSENIANYETNERRHLAHILITISSDADASSVEAAQQKINELAQRLSAGESFEAIAEADSEDSSTAEMGGDLDWIEKGMMDEAFEDAAFNLDETNPISAVVRSDFGFHIIKLLEIEKSGAQPLVSVQEQIVTTLQSEFVDDKFLEVKALVSDLAFEDPDSLNEAASAGGLVVRTTEMFDRQFGIGINAELRNQPAILDNAFSDEVLYEGVNSEIIELTDGNAVILRLLKHQESGISALEDVRDQVITILTQQRTREATEKAGMLVIVALNNDKTAQESLVELPETLAVTWQQQLSLTRTSTDIDVQLRNEAFKIPAPIEGENSIKGVLLNSGNYAVISLTMINDGGKFEGDDAETKMTQLNKQFSDYYIQADIYHYIQYLDEKASISRTISNAALVQ